MNSRKLFATGVLLAIVLLKPVEAAPSFQQIGNTLVMSNVNVRLEYNLTAGTTDFYWQNSKKISAFYSGVTLSTGYIKGINYSSWSYSVISSNQVVVTATGSGLPVMKQYFTLDQPDSFLIRVDMVGTNLSANWMGPVVVDSVGGVDLGITNDNRALLVPFDNDGFVSYNAEPINNSGTSYEVGAFYDNTSRNGLVVGSVTHDTWKTGVFFVGANNQLNAMNVFGGATTPADVMPHGYVSGNTVSSPTMFVGFGADWRVTMQNYAAENTSFVPRLAWTNGVPFGWNSWGVIQQYINYTDAIAVSDYFYVNLMHANFSDNGTVYINLDSFWNNLSSFELQSFVNHVHAHGQKAGIYFGPFVVFLATNQLTNTFIQGSTNTWLYSDAILKDINGNYEMSDGGYALDPTHPGTKDMINYFINLYTNWGFDYIKMDFLSHGSFEGVHYDTNVTTGIEAYNQGMQYVLNAINGRMFISESIAPLFPYQYAHSRRISCDAQTSLIANTAYVMNSVSYGWWLDNLYQFNDPDVMVFNGYGATTNENQSRLISGAVSGLMLDGDALTNSSAINNVQLLLTNQAIANVARVGQTFTPVEGNTGTSAANIFARQNGATWCIAVFNYTSKATNETVNLSRAGLPPGSYNAANLWDGTAAVVTGSFNVSLNAKQSKLFQLTAVAPANLQWSASNNNGDWDTGISTNWINLANSQQMVFNAGSQVLLDDTAGVPTTVTVNGTVSPGLVTVNSSTNNYTFSGSGSISGAGSLVKEGSSTLTIVSPANFTGPVTISGGTIYAGDYSFTDVSSITITNNSTLDFGGGPLTGNKPITVSGTGVNGEGALFNSSYGLFDGSGDQVLNITLAGDTTFGAAGGGGSRWDLADGSTLNGPFKVTINFPGGYGEWDTVAIATNVGDLELAQGTWGLKGLGAGMGNPANTLTVDSGCELDIWNSNFGTNSGYAKNIHFSGQRNFQGSHFTQHVYQRQCDIRERRVLAIRLWQRRANDERDDHAEWPHFIAGGQCSRRFSNVVSGAGGFVSYLYGSSESLVFEASNTYSGPTIIGDGMTLVLTNNGSISGSSLIFLGGNSPASTFLDVSGRSDQTLTLASGQTLAGVGRINGALVVSAGQRFHRRKPTPPWELLPARIRPAQSRLQWPSRLMAQRLSKLNGSGVSDQVKAGAGITYGGDAEFGQHQRHPPLNSRATASQFSMRPVMLGHLRASRQPRPELV